MRTVEENCFVIIFIAVISHMVKYCEREKPPCKISYVSSYIRGGEEERRRGGEAVRLVMGSSGASDRTD